MSTQKRKNRVVKYTVQVQCQTDYLEEQIHKMLMLTIAAFDQNYTSKGYSKTRVSIVKQ